MFCFNHDWDDIKSEQYWRVTDWWKSEKDFMLSHYKEALAWSMSCHTGSLTPISLITQRCKKCGKYRTLTVEGHV